jgi:uncharacterized repeat protein (TIGR01451 family)
MAWIVGIPGPVSAGELIKNGSFETGDFGPYWIHGAYRGNNTNPDLADHVVVPDLPFTGYYSARLGFKYSRERKSAAGFMYQDVTIPANISSARLFFKVRQQGYDTDPYDPFSVQLRNTNNTVLRTLLTLTFTDPSYMFKDSGWVDDDNALPVGVDMAGYAGQTVRLYFEQANTNDNLWETWAYVDDVSLIFKKFVDLVIGGNGADEFGALGSGLGGHAEQSTLPADTTVFNLDVENEGLDTDTYRLTISAPAGWTVRIDAGGGPAGFPYTTHPMSPAEVDHYRVLVCPPAGTAAGSYNVVLDAASVSHSGRFDSVRMGVGVLQSTYGADLVVEGNGYGVVGDGGLGGYALKTASWGTAVPYALELRNTGDAPAMFRVSASTEPGASWRIRYGANSYTAAFNTGTIPPGGTASMTLETTVPQPQPGGDYETIVYSRALPDTTKRDSIKAILRLLEPRVDLIIGGNGDNIYDLTLSGLGGASLGVSEAGLQVTFPVTIQNESGLGDSFRLSWVSSKPNWSAVIVIGGVAHSLPYTTAVLPPYSSLDAELTVTIPTNTKLGTYSSFLNAVSVTSGVISESVTAAVSVTLEGQIDLLIDGTGAGVFGPLGSGLGGDSERTIAPGDSVTFTVELRNLSGANAADVSWNTPPGWRVTFNGRTSPVNACPSGIYPLKVVVPASSPGGTFDIIVDAQKTGRRFYVDSVRGRVYVTTRRVVDALIDGNGDNVYGALGSGLGGFSSQTRSAPAVLRFTIELQNESANPDAYTVSWNAIPWWQASLGGNASPYTTAPVPAGGFELLTFDIVVPLAAFPGVYSYIINIVSTADPGVVESVEARVTIVGPPRADLVIDGNGAGVYGPIGSGEGGYAHHAAGPGMFYTALLEVRNAGSFADSFYVFWQPPVGWPASSVVLNNGTKTSTSPLWTPVIAPGASVTYTVEVRVPPGAGTGVFNTIIDSHSSLAPQLPESVRLTTQTAAVLTGVVFDDRDHDGLFGSGEVGVSGVTVAETATGLAFTTGGDGRYVFLIPGGLAVSVIEHNLSGFVSLTPDTVGPSTIGAGDTLTVDFADVPGIRLSSGAASNGIAGGYVEFAHRLDAGTKGVVSLAVSAEPAAVTMFLLDENEDGQFNGADRALEPADLDMDPSAGRGHLCLILRVFVPVSSPPGTTHRIDIDATQTIDGTAVTSHAEAMDAVVVIENTVGFMTLHKSVDNAVATPGDVLTYTIEFANTGVDSLREIVILDPVSVFVDPLADAFGAGMDVEWRKPGSATAYLTLAPDDGDECDYRSNERLIRVTLSKNSPYLLGPGERGELTYKVIVK